jgi:hypothetical protein
MKLPNSHSAIVPERKVTLYLLNPAHPAGGSKAKFFAQFGFKITEWEKLSEALLLHGRENEVAIIEKNPCGTRYVVDGILISPNGLRLNIRSAWFINSGGDVRPRFVTAHPLPKQ